MANPTTNYGFVLPTPTDLVTDLPADFDVALQGVDTRLKALQPGTTLGDLVYSSATANTNTRLGVGSTGNVLTISGGVPVWAAPAGGGKVLQVVYGSTTTNVNVANTTFVDSNLTATITPSSASSKVLVLVSQNGCFVDPTAGNGVQLQLLRGATGIGQFSYYLGYSNTATRMGSASSVSILDTPATTSATTYKTVVANILASGGSVSVQHAAALSTIILMEIGA